MRKRSITIMTSNYLGEYIYLVPVVYCYPLANLHGIFAITPHVKYRLAKPFSIPL
eukprot:SAG31_NODE_1833_length_7137_cov_2.587667_3_plen_55_part_00